MDGSGADLAKKVGNNVSKSYAATALFGGLCWTMIAKMWASKINCFFSDPAFSAQSRPRAPQSEHHSRSGPQKVAKMVYPFARKRILGLP